LTVSKTILFSELLNNFLSINVEVEAVVVSDEDGLIICGEKREDVDMEIVSVLTAVVNPILERIRDEFSFRKFGNASFDTDNHRLLFISVDEKITLSLVINNMASIDKFSPYAFFLAEKIAQILSAEEDEVIQIVIPNFDYIAEETKRIKHQIYQLRLEKGGVFRFKFIIIGDHEVGKTSIVRRFVENRFSHNYRATIGLNIMSHSFEAFGNKISLSLFDIGAQKYFQRFRRTYYQGAQASFIVYDLTNRETYENIKIWIKELDDFITSEDLPIVIVGNKTDLIEQRQVSTQEGEDLAKELSESRNSKISYIETSALSGENIEDAFSLISYHFIMKSKEREESRLKEELYDEITSIIDEKGSLNIVFIAESPYWSPGLQILIEIEQLGQSSEKEIENAEKIYEYPNGLILKNFLYDNFDVSTADGVFCVFDARDKLHIAPSWKAIVVNIIKNIQENKVVLIGIRVSENMDWSHLMEEINVNQFLEERMVSLMFFKIGEEYRLEIFDELNIMLNTIRG
jgi:small GTP-binding protein